MRRLVLLSQHREQLRQVLFPHSGHEAMAFVLCGRAGVDKYLSHQVLALPIACIESSSSIHVSASTLEFRRILKLAQQNNLVVAVVHSHRRGPAIFSLQDDTDEPELVRLAQNRNGQTTELITMILDESNCVTARWWQSPRQQLPLSILEVGDRLLPLSGVKLSQVDVETYARQLLAFGPAFQQTLSAFRIGIVGAGATGSATAMLLARLGADNLLFIDDDIVEQSNLNRLHGATPEHARLKTPKVEALADSIKQFRPDISIQTHRCRVEDPSIIDVLHNYDIIFGCTDDHSGRLLLNRLSYFYSIPVFDMGIGIDYQPGNPPKLCDVAGRVTVIGAGAPCLLCRDVVDPIQARDDELQRASPEQYQKLLDEAYVRGAGIPNPAVVTITTEVACMAVDELIQRISGYKAVGATANRIRKFRLGEDKRPGLSTNGDECPICQSHIYWGRGDMTPHLDRIAA